MICSLAALSSQFFSLVQGRNKRGDKWKPFLTGGPSLPKGLLLTSVEDFSLASFNTQRQESLLKQMKLHSLHTYSTFTFPAGGDLLLLMCLL